MEMESIMEAVMGRCKLVVRNVSVGMFVRRLCEGEMKWYSYGVKRWFPANQRVLYWSGELTPVSTSCLTYVRLGSYRKSDEDGAFFPNPTL